MFNKIEINAIVFVTIVINTMDYSYRPMSVKQILGSLTIDKQISVTDGKISGTDNKILWTDKQISGRPSLVYLCIVSKNGEYCPNIVYKDGYCIEHNESRQYNIRRDAVLKEKLRISDLIKTNPEIYKCDLSEKIASNKPNWIWNKQMGYHGQFDEHGNEIMRCQCSVCNSSNNDKQKENPHCVSCRKSTDIDIDTCVIA